ncbi:Pex12 [Drosophila busckii]|uniref:Peroxisome assembly protein 12 n=1 Tax=Drosophila busckii TaxID=30019 RepID=A0A0M3QT81_DROBS|nr:LOW QUALITY PROTEIN: peroxisome assembly protein 12 [Drosophila busckii]ALC38453.1 Pex12 [Drosophila busckii]
MAEAANVRQNLQNVPSIFEISAAETLDNLIYPALSKIFDYFGLRLDFKLWGNIRVNEELSPLVTWVLQYLYLRKRASSFGESFYGLQRTVTATGALLSRQQQFQSATLLTLLPYIERKLRTRSAQHDNTYAWETQLINLFHIYNASKAAHTFLYLIKYATSHSPLFRALRLTLRYPSEPPKEDKWTYLFLKLLEVLAFFLQFIQWWYSNDQRRKLGGSLQNPEPLKQSQLSQELQQTEPKRGECPICLLVLQTPTACAVSGYVYCWKCIVTHLKQHGSCPITKYAITLEDLVRIYET